MKCYDLAEAKVYRTLTGHMSNCVAVDYHPYGQFIASGSLDTNLKIWDVRNKMCIQTYKGHSREVNCVKFSPDGRWVASGSSDGTIKMWDLTAGKLLKDFTEHIGAITAMEFNPSELLLATASMDKTIKVYDLERFDMIAATPPDATKVRSITHSPDGRYIFGATQDLVKMWSIDPQIECLATVDVGWRQVADTIVCQSDGTVQLLGGSFQSSFVSINVVDLSDPPPPQQDPPPVATSHRSKEPTPRRPEVQEVTPRQQDPPPVATPRRYEVHVAPPPAEEPIPETTPRQVYDEAEKITPPAIAVAVKPDPMIPVPSKIDAAVEPKRVETPPPPVIASEKLERPRSSRSRKETSLDGKFQVNSMVQPPSVEKNAQSQLNFSDFTTETTTKPEKMMGTAQILSELSNGRDTFSTALKQRLEALYTVVLHWKEGDVKGSIRQMRHMKPVIRQMISCDFFRTVNLKLAVFNLDTCASLFPLALELLSSRFHEYIHTGLKACLQLFLAYSPIVKTTRQHAKQQQGQLELTLENRLLKCNACYEQFEILRSEIDRLRQTNQHTSLVEPMETLHDMLHTFFY